MFCPLQLAKCHLRAWLDTIWRFGHSQKPSDIKNASHILWDVGNGHMGMQLMELNETIN